MTSRGRKPSLDCLPNRIAINLPDAYLPAWKIVRQYGILRGFSIPEMVGRAIHAYAKQLVEEQAGNLSDAKESLREGERALVTAAEQMLRMAAKRQRPRRSKPCT